MYDQCSDDWIALHDAAKPFALICTPYCRSGNRPVEQLWMLVDKGTVKCRPVSAPPADERMGDAIPCSPEWFEAIQYTPERWGLAPGAAHTNFTMGLWQWMNGGGVEVLWADVDGMIRRGPGSGHTATEDRMGDLSLAPTWNFPEALAWVATGSIVEAETMQWAWNAFGPATAVYQDVQRLADWRNEWVGRLAYVTASDHCRCDARKLLPFERWHHCSCLGKAWSSLLPVLNGLGDDKSRVPRLVPCPSESTFSIEWPDGADGVWADQRTVQQLYADLHASEITADSQSPNAIVSRAPAAKAGRPPSDMEILRKANEMKARGLDGRTLAKQMRLEAGFENVATTAVRELIKGRWKPGGRPKKGA